MSFILCTPADAEPASSAPAARKAVPFMIAFCLPTEVDWMYGDDEVNGCMMVVVVLENRQAAACVASVTEAGEQAPELEAWTLVTSSDLVSGTTIQ